MGISIKALYERKAEHAAQIKTLADLANDKDRDWSAEDEQRWDAVNTEYNDLVGQIGKSERAAEVIADLDKRTDDGLVGRDDYDGRDKPNGQGDRDDAPTTEDRAVGFQAWVRAQMGEPITDEQEAACKRLKVNPYHVKKLSVQLQRKAPKTPKDIETRALSAVTLGTGGALVPTGFVNNLERALLTFGGMRSVADIIRTADGGDLPWPHSDDTSNTGELVGENTTVGEQDAEFGQLVLHAYKYTSKMIKVPSELLQDSAFDLGAILADMLGERLGRRQNTDFTTGTGASRAKGVVTASTTGKTTASGTAIVADELLEMLHSINPSYRPQSTWMMHDNILLAIRKLKDGEGRYLWQESIQLGVPDRLHNHPIVINQDMQSSVSSATKTILFGDLSKYKIREVSEIRFFRLLERYRDTDQDGFVAFMRFDGNYLNAGGDPIKHLLQA